MAGFSAAWLSSRLRFQEEAPPVELVDEADVAAPIGGARGFATGLDEFARGVLEENERLEHEVAELHALHSKHEATVFELTRKRDDAVKQVSAWASPSVTVPQHS